jgi:hypothetical protein
VRHEEGLAGALELKDTTKVPLSPQDLSPFVVQFLGCKSRYCSLCVKGCLTLHQGTAPGCLTLHEFAILGQSHTSRRTTDGATPADMPCEYAIASLEVV